MVKKIIKYVKIRKEKADRRALEEKVKKGTDLAIREYRDVFIKLADYDRT